MAKIQYAQGYSTTIAASTTQFLGIGQGCARTSGTEAQTQIPLRSSGTLSNFSLRIITNDRGASTARVRKNGANGNQSISIPASNTGLFEDTVNTDTVSAGDKFNYSIATGAGGTGFVPTTASILFDATSNTVTRFASQAVSSSTNHQALGGTGGGTTTESRAQLKVRTSGTFKNLCASYTANTRTSATTVTFRLNGANTALAVSVGAGVTGDVEDTTDTVSVVANDLVNTQTILDAGTGSLTTAMQSVDFETTNNNFHFMTAEVVSGATLTTSTTTYFPVGGTLALNSTTNEFDVATKSYIDFTASNIGVRISANTVSATSTLRFRIDNTNGNQAASITASTTGYFEDTVNTDDVFIDSQINYALTTGATGTNLVVRNIAMMGNIAGGGVTNRLYLGSTAIRQLYLGSTQIKKVYLGSTVVYSDT